MPPQLSIHRKGLKKALWVSKDAPLVSQNGQINYKHSLTTHLTKSRGLTKFHNNPDVANSRYPAGRICHHLKGTIHWQVSRKMVHWGYCHCLNIMIYWRVIGNETVKTQRSGSFEGSSRHKSSILWLVMRINILKMNKENDNNSVKDDHLHN